MASPVRETISAASRHVQQLFTKLVSEVESENVPSGHLNDLKEAEVTMKLRRAMGANCEYLQVLSRETGC